MSYQRASIAISLTLLFATAGSAQTRITPSRPKIGTARAKTVRPEPCWEEAGISKSVIEQRRQIERNTRAEIQSVCNDSSLTPEQKREKIRQLHQQAHQQMQGLITPQQREALKACQQQRSKGHASANRPPLHRPALLPSTFQRRGWPGVPMWCKATIAQELKMCVTVLTAFA